MKLGGRNIEIGNGVQPNGFLESRVFAMWGVRTYLQVWGPYGEAVERARTIQAAQASKLRTCVDELEKALKARKEDMEKHKARSLARCRGACPNTNLRCDACQHRRRPAFQCRDCKALNCRDCGIREQHEHVEALIRKCKDKIMKLI